MRSSSRAEIVEAFDAFSDAVSRVGRLSFDSLTTPELLGLLERLEHETCRLPVPRHELINRVRQQATPAEIGGKLSHVLADRLRITRAEANRRIEEAQDLGPRQALTGEPLAPRLAATAAAQRAGVIGGAHVRVIRGFLRDVPCWIDADTRQCAEAKLAKLGTQYRPEQLAKLADKLADCLNPDGDFSDQDPGPPPRPELGQTRSRRHVAASRLPDPGRPGGPGGRAGQTGRPRHGQPLRP